MRFSRVAPSVGIGVWTASRRLREASSSSVNRPPRRVTPCKGAFVSSDSFRAKKGREAALIPNVRSLNLQYPTSYMVGGDLSNLTRRQPTLSLELSSCVEPITSCTPFTRYSWLTHTMCR